MLKAWVNVSGLAFDVAWLAAGLERRPPALLMPSPGATVEERRALEQQAWAELHQSGAARQGRLARDFSDALTVLGWASQELYGFFGPAGGATCAVIAGTRGQDAVLAIVGDGRVDLATIRATNVSESVLSVLPGHPKGHGPTLSAPLSAAEGHPVSDGSILQRSDGGGGDAGTGARIRHVLNQPRVGGGQFYAASRDRWGKRTRNPAFLTIVDNGDGRYLAEKRPNDRGEPWVILAPADDGLLVRAFGTMLGWQ